MDLSRFAARFSTYCAQAREAQAQARHHDYRRQLFLGFLHDAFGIEAADVDVEQYLQIAGKQVSAAGVARIRKGWIDAVFRDLVFEFKRDLAAEAAEGLRELRDYLSTLPNGTSCVGLLTDGLTFRAYVLDDTQPNGLRQTDSIDLAAAPSHVAYQWLDAYLLRQRNLAPTAADIVQRFGVLSPTFIAAARLLREALGVFGASEAGALEVKRQQWAFHLARVYGSSDVTNDEMFVRHTYLCQFAKLLAYTARFGIGEATEKVEHIIDGSAFEVLGVDNIGEQDFFAWVLAPEVRPQTLGLFRHLIASFAVYDLSRIDEDLLKQLYQDLVGPETRHELGEFYTPDWLAELTLREIGYRPSQSLLDPACGSGAFLFSAIRRLVEQGLTGAALVDFALDNVMGMDVHPLAVTIARINYMLAILPHLQQGAERAQRSIPVALANSLLVPAKAHRIAVIEVALDAQRSFQIPVEAAQHPNTLAAVLAAMGDFAVQAAAAVTTPKQAKVADFGSFAVSKLPPEGGTQEFEVERLLWNTNVRWLVEQIQRGRDSIWVYLLKNTSRPLVLRHRKFDVVVGNPPWIAYRYLHDPTYQRDIKTLVRDYGLAEAGEVKLNTQMELATLFFEHCWSAYLRPGGTIAFVMPRSVITGAKQHHLFQQRGFSRVLDLKGVAPLFNTETCVLIRQGIEVKTNALPTTRFAGRLPRHELPLAEATPFLTRTESTTDFVDQDAVASPYYHPRFKQGATLVPRNLVFVTSAQPGLAPGQRAHSTIMRTDPDMDAEAKEPWKGLRLEGHIDESFLYATLLSKDLMPFGARRLHLVALPFRVGIPATVAAIPGQPHEVRFIPVSIAEMRDALSMPGIANPTSIIRSADDWFEPAERLWQAHKKETTKETVAEWVNYQNKLVGQRAEAGYLVAYGAAGSNISAAVIGTSELPVVNGAQPQALVVDYTTFWYCCATATESHYLSAILNAPCVDAAIKPHQPRGIYVGPRHIQRRPFEVCPIPQFDSANADHQQLAHLSHQAHRAVAEVDLSAGGVVAARKKARQAAREYIAQIDALAQRLLGLAAAPEGYAADERDGDESLDEAAEA